MIYRGKPCEVVREFSDGTGTGREGLLDGKVVIREYAESILTPGQTEAAEKLARAMVEEENRIAALEALRAKVAAGTATTEDRTRALDLLIASPRSGIPVAAVVELLRGGK